MAEKGYARGLNLGGWLAQYPREPGNHFDSFIVEEDINTIASWGMDHVRLPFDHRVFTEGNGFNHIDDCLEWCRRAGLNLILDCHFAPGQSYDVALKANPLLSERTNREGFFTLWETVTRRYRSSGEELRFDILNEIVDPTGYGWNPFAVEAIQRIRSIDPSRVLLLGGNLYNSVHTLKELVRPNDERIVFSFHFYEPTLFTHQRAYWADQVLPMASSLEYPGDFSWLRRFLDENPRFARDYAALAWEKNDRDYMRFLLADAVRFIANTGKRLYCGELGVIDAAPEKSAARWVDDALGTLEEHGIGWCLWTYKALDFGVVDAGGRIARPAILEAARGKHGGV